MTGAGKGTSRKPSAARVLVPASLSALDGLEVDTLILLVPEDERPLQGAAGLLDWRLCGWLGERLLDGTVTGKRGERVLLNTWGRLPVARVIALGAGPSAQVEASLDALLDEVSTVAKNADCAAAALAGPCAGSVLQAAVDRAPAGLQERVKLVLDPAA